MKYLKSDDQNFRNSLEKLLAFETTQDANLDELVATICDDIKNKGDIALIEYTNRFDNMNVNSINELILHPDDLKNAFNTLKVETQEALIHASKRIESYHYHQKQKTWTYEDEDGNTLGQKITPLDCVGIYVPGGKAAYPSSVLMNAIPAHVAGVKDILMVVPTPNPVVLGAAYVAGVTKVITIGGAQAIAALAYGTESIKPVDKITGPGNAYVAAAKRRVFGIVGIDMVAGPSEILVISDGTTPAEWIAMDLFSQAEHDEIAQSILITNSENHAEEVKQAMSELLKEQPRQEIISKSLENRGAIIIVKNIEEACDIANYIAPEHLELSTLNAEQYLDLIKHAGAIFIGAYTTESFGDYSAGPNHVLPTSRTARFASPLGVYDFQKKTSIIKVSTKGLKQLGHISSVLAREEGLIAHACAAEYRLNN